MNNSTFLTIKTKATDLRCGERVGERREAGAPVRAKILLHV